MLYHSARFRKQWKHLSLKIKDEADSRIEILKVHEFNAVLNNHKLSGKYAEYRSINVTGDIRVAYKRVPDGFYLAAIGTHSELYK
jgi:mRNA-degrading endonuclease YafQ of YafQ-DinJ toxin-antitoxin module